MSTPRNYCRSLLRRNGIRERAQHKHKMKFFGLDTWLGPFLSPSWKKPFTSHHLSKQLILCEELGREWECCDDEGKEKAKVEIDFSWDSSTEFSFVIYYPIPGRKNLVSFQVNADASMYMREKSIKFHRNSFMIAKSDI